MRVCAGPCDRSHSCALVNFHHPADSARRGRAFRSFAIPTRQPAAIATFQLWSRSSQSARGSMPPPIEALSDPVCQSPARCGVALWIDSCLHAASDRQNAESASGFGAAGHTKRSSSGFLAIDHVSYTTQDESDTSYVTVSHDLTVIWSLSRHSTVVIVTSVADSSMSWREADLPHASVQPRWPFESERLFARMRELENVSAVR